MDITEKELALQASNVDNPPKHIVNPVGMDLGPRLRLMRDLNDHVVAILLV